ncbi:MAG: histidine phosphotransferase [Gemmobacter sp.]|jgi:histidine phosphotransferase ChpT|nr:histidine phosphotransferase [Gemmobacter sp.]
MTDRPDLVALLGSRICHDLISPIGAIGNGVELLMLEGQQPGPEISLIADSAASANARLRFFRIGFGASGAEQRLGRAEILGLLADLTRGGRIGIGWTSPADLPRREARLAFLLIMCLETAMSYGGAITVERGETGWQILGRAPRLRIDPDLWELLSNPAAPYDLTAAQVHFALVHEALTRHGRSLLIDIRESEIRLEF